PSPRSQIGCARFPTANEPPRRSCRWTSARGASRAHLLCHQPAVLAELPGAGKPLLLEHGHGGVVQERVGDLAPFDILGRALDRPAAESRDLAQGTLQRGGGHTLV